MASPTPLAGAAVPPAAVIPLGGGTDAVGGDGGRSAGAASAAPPLPCNKLPNGSDKIHTNTQFIHHAK